MAGWPPQFDGAETVPTAVRALRAYGPVGAAAVLGALRFGDRIALIDDRGALTFAQLDQRSNALANAWRSRGLGPDSSMGILCRNHRGLLDAMSATAKIGARVLFLNTDFAAPQLREAITSEGVTALVYDEEFAATVEDIDLTEGKYLAGAESPTSLDELIAKGDPAPPPPPGRHGSFVILTSGTSGKPKGAPRSQAQGRSAALTGGILAKIPLRRGDVVFVGPPLFHGFGLVMSALALGTGSTLVLRRRFDAEQVLADLAEHRCSVLIAVPVMLNRMLAVDKPGSSDLSTLRIIATGGARLEAVLAQRVMGRFGDILYNFYGSTEASSITIATPEDLKAAPGCVGRPPLGTTVRILDDEGREAPVGMSGQIFVDGPARFSGYTGGGTKETIGSLMATGDVGHLDTGGRLVIDGRADDMVVSGGENVYPSEVEELLAGHEAVREAAVIGVPDEEFGQRLCAFVVRTGRLNEDEVKSYVGATLARYKIPRDVVFLDELPRNPTGKVLKRRLAARRQ